MSIEQHGRMPLDYQPAALSGSALRFRGPVPKEHNAKVVCVGASETFGRFIGVPYATQLEHALGVPVLNLGVVNAGLEVMLNDQAIAEAIGKADALVLQITSAHNMTNRFYSVHPRRNDRFLSASGMLRTIYPQVDFTEFHFTRHLLIHLQAASEDRFEIVRTELELAWVARMRRFISDLPIPVHLLWISNRAPDVSANDLTQHPLFVTSKMLEEVHEVSASLTIAAPGITQGPSTTRGKFFGPSEEAAARLLPGPELHAMAAEGLVKQMRP